MSRYLYGFGNGASYLSGATQRLAPSLDPPNGSRVTVYGKGGQVTTRLGPYPTQEEAGIVARHVMGLGWCVATVERG